MEKALFDESAEQVVERNVRLLDVLGVPTGNRQKDVAEFSEFSAAVSGERYDLDASRFRFFGCFRQVEAF